MKNIEISRKGIGQESLHLLNTVVEPKITLTFKKLMNDLEVLNHKITKYRGTILFAFAIIAVLIVAVVYFNVDTTKNAIDSQTWTNVDLSNTKYEYNSDLE